MSLVVHGEEVVLHFLFVVDAVKRRVDCFMVESTPAIAATVALYSKLSPVFMKGCAVAPRTCESRGFGG